MNVSGETLAIDGGIPVRDERRRPWPTWPVVSENEWITRVEPALRQVYLSHTEGLSGESTQAFACAQDRQDAHTPDMYVAMPVPARRARPSPNDRCT